MGRAEEGERVVEDGLQHHSEGTGALLQRDYWAVIRGCEIGPRALVEGVRHRFEEFAPPSIARFKRSCPPGRALEVGDELEVDIRQAGRFAVRVTHVDSNSLTLATMQGHPEAGRITFGAYRNSHEDVIFHIRSIARSSSPKMYAGFLIAGDPMQTYTWTDFVDCVAHTFGDGIVGRIQAEMKHAAAAGEDEAMDRPTYLAEGD